MAIQTSHVGSLPRSQKVVDYIFAREKDFNKRKILKDAYKF